MIKYKDINNKFNTDGFCIIKNQIPKKKIKEMELSFFSIYSKFLKKKVNKKNYSKIISEYESFKRYDELYIALKKFSSSKKFLSFNNFFKTFLKKTFKKNFNLINTGMAIGLSNSQRTAYKWHQEKPYYPKKKTVHLQFPLIEKCKKQNGTMSVLVGSNKEGFIKSLNKIKKNKKSITSLVPKDIKKLKAKYKEQYICMNNRDFVLFHENIIHKTNQNISSKIRLACIYRYEGSYEYSSQKSK